MANCDCALALRPDHAATFCNRAAAAYVLGRFDEALANYNHTITLQPDHAGAHFGKATLRLLAGDFARGWPEMAAALGSRSTDTAPFLVSMLVWCPGYSWQDHLASQRTGLRGRDPILPLRSWLVAVARRPRHSGSAGDASRLDAQSLRRRADRVQRRRASCVRPALPIAQLAARIRNAA